MKALPISRAHPRRIAGFVTVAGLLATAIGDAAPEGLDWDGPGPAIFAVLALLVAVVPGRSMVLLSVLVSGVFLYGAFTAPGSLARLSGPAVLDVASAVVQIAGLVCAIVAGVVVLWPALERARIRS